MSVAPGRYRHYKGTLYDVIGVAKHTETLEDLVVYRDVRHPEKVWIRPLAMFMERVEREGYAGPRFQYIGEHA